MKCLAGQEPVLPSVSFRCMNTWCEVAGDGQVSDDRSINGVVHWFYRMENIFSRFNPQSELSFFNGIKPNTPYMASEPFFQVLDLVQQIEKDTEGLITPRVYGRLCELGYDQSFEKMDRTVSREVSSCPIPPNEEWIRIDHSMRSLIRLSDVQIDLGAFVKGWSVDRAAAWMKRNGHREGLINAGGDLNVWGNGERWTVDIADPFNEEKIIFQLEMLNGAVATSGIGKRSWGNGMHHIIDPRTGLPANSGVIQATVAAESTLTAEIYSKLFIILGADETIRWMKQRRLNFPFWLVLKNGEPLISEETGGILWKTI